MIRKQLIVLAGGVSGFAVVFLVWHSAPQLFVRVPLPAPDAASRLAYVAHWLILPGLTLLAGVLGASWHRGFAVGAIEGTRMPASHGLEINLRYIQNTLEQTVLAAIAWVGLGLALARDDLILIPVMAFLFAFGRIAFWIGYVLHPLARAFGMVLTALPTVALLLVACMACIARASYMSSARMPRYFYAPMRT